MRQFPSIQGANETQSPALSNVYISGRVKSCDLCLVCAALETPVLAAVVAVDGHQQALQGLQVVVQSLSHVSSCRLEWVCSRQSRADSAPTDRRVAILLTFFFSLFPQKST